MTEFTLQRAAELLANWLETPVQVKCMRPLTGGMVNQVLYVEFDHDPGRAVLKVQPSDAERKYFATEYVNLRHLREHDFPVPKPYFLHTGDGRFDVLAIEYWDAVNMGELGWRRNAGDVARIEREMATVLLALHSHQRETYGPVDAPGTPSWAEAFARRVRPRHRNIKDKISDTTFRQITDIIDHFDVIFADAGPPTLVHGDIWATNIMLDQREDDWHLRGFVDPGALYADVEYELAYLEVFNTARRAFFETYTTERPLRDGYELRRAVYWLNTMIIHVDHFGDAHYRRNTTSLAGQLSATLGLD